MTSEIYMRKALELAAIAESNGDVPVGCVIVHNDEIIGEGYNQVELTGNPLNHAEIIAIEEAVKNYGHKHLIDCDIYVNLEPCSMCAGAIILSRISKVIYASPDEKTGAGGSLYNILEDDRLNHRCEVHKGILHDESSVMLKNFFKKLRSKSV
jgi:tRNA(adenine34) deaminase